MWLGNSYSNSSLAPHSTRNMDSHSSLAPSEPQDNTLYHHYTTFFVVKICKIKLFDGYITNIVCFSIPPNKARKHRWWSKLPSGWSPPVDMISDIFWCWTFHLTYIMAYCMSCFLHSFWHIVWHILTVYLTFYLTYMLFLRVSDINFIWHSFWHTFRQLTMWHFTSKII